jgi:hypothetical protein
MAESWKTESLRLTVFPSPNQQFVQRNNWWISTVGTDPDTISEQPRSAVYQAMGAVTPESQLLLSVQPDRIDWQLSASDKHREAEGLPTIGSLDEALSIIVPKLEAWLQHQCPECQRLALGVVLLRQVLSRVEGYERLKPYLPAVTLDPENSTDFSYSINRPRMSEREGVSINRLSRWGVVNLKTFRLAHLGAAGLTQVLEPLAGDYFACRLELDISTPAERQSPFSRSAAINILRELVGFANEIADRGDIQ